MQALLTLLAVLLVVLPLTAKLMAGEACCCVVPLQQDSKQRHSA